MSLLPLLCPGVFMIPADPYKRTHPGHFLNIPITASPSADSVMDYCPTGKDCVVEQIRRQAQVLGNREASLQKRRMALMYLVHFVADEHQPLHAAEDEGKNLGKAYENERHPIAKKRAAMAGLAERTRRLSTRLQPRDSAVKFD